MNTILKHFWISSTNSFSKKEVGLIKTNTLGAKSKIFCLIFKFANFYFYKISVKELKHQ
jgi:hypothetical protein